MSARALVIGGTGPTGPFVVEGLAARGYEVTIFHGGQHEVEFAVPNIRHIHEDPHFAETLTRGLEDQGNFDLVIAQYGRLKDITDVLAGRTARLVAIGGATAIYAPEQDHRWGGAGRPAWFPDTSDILNRDPASTGPAKLGYRMVQALDALFDHHAQGHFSATYVGYPLNYGPRNPGQYDWTVIRRLLEGRTRLVIADGGLKLETRIMSENAAHAVLLIVDNEEVAAGKRYSVADRYTYSMRQRIEFIARCLDRPVELIDMPYPIAWPCHPLWRHTRSHQVCQSTLIREELGYHEIVEPDIGLAQSVEWLVGAGVEPDGETALRIGDPFDYAAEDELIRRWSQLADAATDLAVELPSPGHQYRHPTAPGDAWRSEGAK